MLVQEVINLARLDLNDEDKARWTDAYLLNHVRTYVQELQRSRPDLFLGRFEEPFAYSLLLTAPFPTTDRYVRSCADYVIARAMMNSTEEGSIAIANNYLALAAKEAGL